MSAGYWLIALFDWVPGQTSRWNSFWFSPKTSVTSSCVWSSFFFGVFCSLNSFVWNPGSFQAAARGANTFCNACRSARPVINATNLEKFIPFCMEQQVLTLWRSQLSFVSLNMVLIEHRKNAFSLISLPFPLPHRQTPEGHRDSCNACMNTFPFRISVLIPTEWQVLPWWRSQLSSVPPNYIFFLSPDSCIHLFRLDSTSEKSPIAVTSQGADPVKEILLSLDIWQKFFCFFFFFLSLFICISNRYTGWTVLCLAGSSSSGSLDWCDGFATHLTFGESDIVPAGTIRPHLVKDFCSKEDILVFFGGVFLFSPQVYEM